MKHDIFLPSTEKGMLIWQCQSLGTRNELLDLIDFAKRHNGIVTIEHLYEELKELSDLDYEALEIRNKTYISKEKDLIDIFKKQNNKNNNEP